MPENIEQLLAELIADLGDAIVGGAAVRARVAAILDQRDGGPIGPERVIAIRYGSSEAIG